MACTSVQFQSSVGRKVFTEGESSMFTTQLPQSWTSLNSRQGERKGRVCAVTSSRGVTAGGGDLTAALRLARVEESEDLWSEKSGGTRDQGKKPTIAPQLDQLMKESVTEIVKNISKAPFLVHIYTSTDTNNEPINPSSPSTPPKLVIEKTSPDDWPSISQRWEDGSPRPDGIILVEELGSEDHNTHCCDTCSSSTSTSNDLHLIPPSSSSNSNSTKLWGLLVQGRGVTCPSCYILKTCQVQCCFGFSTHFSLTKVDCFGVSADYHLSKMWLQR